MAKRSVDGWRWPAHPFIYEINTWPWLTGLARDAGGPVDLGSLPDAIWDEIAANGFDAVWLMGVWTRSPAGVAIARTNPELLESFERALPDFGATDIVGSPYCVRDYRVDDHLGGPQALAGARAALAARGVGLVLDFVPNHVAPDHPWVAEYPERFVDGTADDLRDHPESFIEIGGHVLANGKDPNYAAWPDVVQLNAFSTELRTSVIETLTAIAGQCDGVRCDMAMLMINDVFQRTWGERAGTRPDDEYWPTVINAVHQTYPEFRFIAEAYWDLEWCLQQQGFAFCYDKRLYDRLLHETPAGVRAHLGADVEYQEHLVRFLENHDEPRAAAVLDTAREEALAVATLTQTGARRVYDGQLEGRRTRLPVFLGRAPTEPVDESLATFYRSLLAVVRDPTFRRGDWQLCTLSGWPNDDRFDRLVAWCWRGRARYLVVVNLAGDASTGLVHVPWPELRGCAVRLDDRMSGASFDRRGGDLCDGMYVELGAWSWHLFRVDIEQEVGGSES